MIKKGDNMLDRKSSLIIQKLTERNELPMELLLSADPSEEQVMTYVLEGECYVALVAQEVVGVYVLLQKDPHTSEIMNVAVAEHLQGQGIGKKLILHALEVAKLHGMKKVEIGTGNSSIGQLALYQKCGFRMTSLVENYFTYNYPEPIFENGIQCKDMVRLTFVF